MVEGRLQEDHSPEQIAGWLRLRYPVAVQAFPLSDVKAYMGHADIQTTMIYVHHVPQHDAAERLSRTVAASGDFLEVIERPEHKAA